MCGVEIELFTHSSPNTSWILFKKLHNGSIYAPADATKRMKMKAEIIMEIFDVEVKMSQFG